MNTKKMDAFIMSRMREIIEKGAISEGARPKYKSDGGEANSKYITDEFIKFDISKGELPISVLRPVYTGLARQEMLWIWQDQSSNLDKLRERGVFWWDDWEIQIGNDYPTIGFRYGHTVAKNRIIDFLLDKLEKNPYNRRNIGNLWQYDDLEMVGSLDPCAYEIILDVRKVDGIMYLDMSLNQRSSDFIVAGMGINQIQYVALQMMIAKHLGWQVGTFSWHVMNLHLYDRYIDQAKTLINRGHGIWDDFGTMKDFYNKQNIEFYLDVPDKTNFYDIKAEDFVMKGYKAIGEQMQFDLAI